MAGSETALLIDLFHAAAKKRAAINIRAQTTQVGWPKAFVLTVGEEDWMEWISFCSMCFGCNIWYGRTRRCGCDFVRGWV
jgi:hypothetical protein